MAVNRAPDDARVDAAAAASELDDLLAANVVEPASETASALAPKLAFVIASVIALAVVIVVVISFVLPLIAQLVTFVNARLGAL